MPRRLGQHFLVRQSVLERIAKAACPEKCDTIIEIGPGKGALTTHLLERAARVIAIEIDPVLVQYLRSKFRDDTRLHLVEADVLKTDLTQWGSATVAGNLPYYITSPIIHGVLSMGSLLHRGVFLVQKEVAERLTAMPGSPDYGYLSVETQLLSIPGLLFSVPAAAFRPPPQVDSAVVQLVPHTELPAPDLAGFLKFVGLCFQQKRKTLRNNLIGTYPKELVDRLADAKKRAEQLSIGELISLYTELAGADGKSA